MEFKLVEDYKVNVIYKVEITHINNPHSFYVRSVRCKPLNRTNINQLPKIKFSNLLLGSKVVYKSQISNEFVRGNIIGINKSEQTCEIFAMDYGYLDKSVSTEDIFKPRVLPMMVPPMARHCKLFCCEPINGAFTNDNIQAMKTFIGNEYCQMQVKAINNTQMTVILQNSCINDIATMLCLSLNSYIQTKGDLSISINTPDQPARPKVILKTLKVNDVLHIRMLTAKSLIPNTHYVADVNDYKMYGNNCIIFTNHCQFLRAMTEEDLEVGKTIAHKKPFDNHYERAVIKSINNNKKYCYALIYLIDTGETKEAAPHQMKEIKCMYHFETPGIAFQCTFKESLEVTQKLPENIIPGYEVWIKIKEIGDPNIVEIVSKPHQ